MLFTSQRKLILEELKKLKSHPTADEFYNVIKSKIPKISLGSVYRNLELMSKHGIINKIEVSGTQKRFDGNVDRHHHLRCRACGKVMDFSYHKLVEAEKVLEEVLRENALENFRLEFVGVCDKCEG